MDMGVRKLPKKRKFDPSELEENHLQAPCIPVSVVQCTSVMSAPQATAVDYSCPQSNNGNNCKQNAVDLSEWCDHRVLARQGDWYYPGGIRDASGSTVSTIYLTLNCFLVHYVFYKEIILFFFCIYFYRLYVY